MANSLQYTDLFQKNLDKAAEQQAKTGWMEKNAGKVKYTGGREVKIPVLSMDGLGNYDKSTGFADGDITLTYQTKEMTQDRGRAFNLDEIDVDETGAVVTAGTVMAEFQRTKVVPEIDAYRISKLSQFAMSVAGDTQVEYGYAPAKTTVVAKIKAGIQKLRKNGFEGDLVCYATYDVVNLVSEYYGEKLAAATFAINGVDTRVPSIDGVPLIEMTDSKMVTKITLRDGKTTGQTIGGFTKAADGLDLNFLIVSTEVPIAVQKTDKVRLFDPETNQKARAWRTDYRKYHDIWATDEGLNGIFASIKDSKPSA